jgi:hypothetical protein
MPVLGPLVSSSFQPGELVKTLEQEGSLTMMTRRWVDLVVTGEQESRLLCKSVDPQCDTFLCSSRKG